MQNKEWSKLWHNSPLDVALFQAFYVQHAYPRHSHDYYVICVIERGFQTFTHGSAKYFTPPGGVILINPGVVHTGKPADTHGFEMTCLYPTTARMETAAYELTGRHAALPFFGDVRVDNPATRESILAVHRTMTAGASTLEYESRLTWTLAQLVKQYADARLEEQRLGREQNAVVRTRNYIEENFAEGIRLTDLAEHVSLSPYYLLRVFRAEVGMPPYAYHESVRIRHAQRLIEAGKPLVDIAAEIGFSSQSHFTNRFKQFIGVTPGQYAHSIQISERAF